MATAWFVLMLACLGMYIVLDGYDLGIGVASLFERDGRKRRLMLEEVSVAWDANESWLVLLMVALWAGFPLAFGTILPALYLPVIVVLLSLIVRGISIEMASQGGPSSNWERSFGIASLSAALAQGVALGALTANLSAVNGASAGSPLGSIGWFSILAAATVTVGYVGLGYAYLKWKTTGALRASAARRGTVSAVLATLLATVSLVAVNGTAAPLVLDDARRAVIFVVLLLVAAVGVGVALTTLRPSSSSDSLPLFGLATTTVALLIAIAVARYPLLAPGLTTDATVSPESTMTFLAVGVGLNLPLLLIYNWIAHHAFSGKATSAAGRETLDS
jgi:cytochrome d ubiquinol oxidase subunit II